MKLYRSDEHDLHWADLIKNPDHEIWKALQQWQADAPLFNIDNPLAQLRYLEDPIKHHTLQLKDIIQENALKFGIPGALIDYHQKAARQGADPKHLGALIIQAIIYGIAYTLQSEQRQNHLIEQHHKKQIQLQNYLREQEQSSQGLSLPKKPILLDQRERLDAWLQTQLESVLASIAAVLNLQEQLYQHLHQIHGQHEAIRQSVNVYIENWLQEGALDALLAPRNHVSNQVQQWLHTELPSILTERITDLVLQAEDQGAINKAPKIVFAALEKVLDSHLFLSRETLDEYFTTHLDAIIARPETLDISERSERFSDDCLADFQTKRHAIQLETKSANALIEQMILQDTPMEAYLVDLETSMQADLSIEEDNQRANLQP